MQKGIFYKMSDSRLITYVAVGHRDLPKLDKSIELVRNFEPGIPIRVYHDMPASDLASLSKYNVNLRKYERIKYPKREENRNSSYWRLISLKESEYETTLYLDNDIYVVHKGFFEGFKIAKEYGILMVQNPRMFIKTQEQDIGDLDIGADVLPYDKSFVKDMPDYMTAYNMGVTFYSELSEDFLDELIWEQKNNPSRGQAGLYRTIWKTRTAPYCLPINWLVCKKHCDIENPLSLHVGHKNVLERYEAEFQD